MSNLRIIYDNAVDRATSLAASTTAGALVAANMQNDDKGQVHRSTGTSVTYTLTWTDGESIGGGGFPATNLTADATVQMRLYDATVGGTLLADTGVVYAVPGNPLDLWNWTEPLNANAFAFGGAAKFALWFDEQVFAKRCEIDIVDAGNEAGYIDCARLVVGAYWSPQLNVGYGAQAAVVDQSKNSRADSGSLRSDRSTQHDSLTFDLTYLPEQDRASVMRIMRNVGVTRNVLVSLLPNNEAAVAEQDYLIYGKRENSPVSMNHYRAYSNKITMEGW